MACYRRKSTVWPGKLISSKKHLKTAFFGGKKSRHHLTLGRSGGQTVDTRSTSGVPLKSLGYNGSPELLGRSVASKLSPQQAGKKKSRVAMKFREKTEFFYSSAFSSKTKRDIGTGPTGEMMLTYRATNALLTISGCGAVLTVFCLPEVGRCR